MPVFAKVLERFEEFFSTLPEPRTHFVSGAYLVPAFANRGGAACSCGVDIPVQAVAAAIGIFGSAECRRDNGLIAGNLAIHQLYHPVAACAQARIVGHDDKSHTTLGVHSPQLYKYLVR